MFDFGDGAWISPAKVHKVQCTSLFHPRSLPVLPSESFHQSIIVPASKNIFNEYQHVKKEIYLSCLNGEKNYTSVSPNFPKTCAAGQRPVNNYILN